LLRGTDRLRSTLPSLAATSVAAGFPGSAIPHRTATFERVA
jgi:hypothetical protein